MNSTAEKKLTPEEKARLIVADITAAFASGVRHRDKHGRTLTTPLEVLLALQRDGTFEFQAPPDFDLPTYRGLARA